MADMTDIWAYWHYILPSLAKDLPPYVLKTVTKEGYSPFGVENPAGLYCIFAKIQREILMVKVKLMEVNTRLLVNFPFFNQPII